MQPIVISGIAAVSLLIFADFSPSFAQSELAQAKATYDQMCAGCHGTQGDGQEGTKSGFVPRVGTLANKEYMASVPDEYLLMIIKKGGAYMGKYAAMPAWEKKFTEQEIVDIVKHIRTF